MSPKPVVSGAPDAVPLLVPGATALLGMDALPGVESDESTDAKGSSFTFSAAPAALPLPFIVSD
jgi:hypothetical protein